MRATPLALSPVPMHNGSTHEPPPEWRVVCMGCLRIKRNGRWTLEHAKTYVGVSTGYCDDCYDRERKRRSWTHEW